MLATIWLASFLAFLDRINLSVAMPNIASDFSLTPQQSGWLLSSFFITYTIFQIPGGLLSDRKSPRTIAALALSWWSAMTVLMGFVRGFADLYILRLLFGIGEGVYPPASLKIVSNWFADSERATANAIWASANSFGPAFGLPVAVLIISAWGWHALFMIVGVLGFLIVLLWVFVVRDAPERTVGRSGGDTGAVETVPLSSLVNRNTLLLVAAYFSFLCTFYGLLTWLPTYLMHARGISFAGMGYCAGLPFLTLGIAQPIGGWLSDKVLNGRRRTVIICATLLAAPTLYLVILAQSDVLAIAALSLAGFVLGLVFGPFWALVIESSERKCAGTIAGIVNTGGNVGGIVSPIIIGYLVGMSGYSAAFVFMIVAQLSCAAFVWAIGTPARQISAGAIPAAPGERCRTSH